MEIAKSKIVDDEQYRRTPAAAQYSLIELVLLMFFASIACALASNGVAALGIAFLLTAVAFRTSCVDFSIIGQVAVPCTVLFGTITLVLLVIYSTGLG